MAAQPEPLELAEEFPAASREQWRTLVAAVLRRSGRPGDLDPELALTSTTADGIRLAPLYTAEDAPGAPIGRPGCPPFVRGATAGGPISAGWDARQRHADPDPARTNSAVLADLGGGVTSLWLTVGPAGIAVADLPEVLDGVRLDAAAVALDAGTDTVPAAFALLTLAEQQGLDPAELRGTLGADPISVRARTGAKADLGPLLTLSEQSKAASGLCLATVDATVYHDAGAGDADELGIATAVGVAYLRALAGAGRPVDEALDRLEFRFAVTADQFGSIAKLRAARRVWDRVAELSGATAGRRGQRQHAVSSAAMMARRDPWANLLRTTIACFAAAVGGAEAITVAPFDAAIGLPDEFARRIARNTQAVLHDESSLSRVSDAAGGSWYVESLTDALAHKAWQSFTAIERAGGALAALDDGTIEAMIATTRAARREDIAHRRAPIIGVSEFADLAEQPVVRLPAPARAASAPTGDGAPSAPLPAVRCAEQFETLRDRSDAQLAAAGTRPRVFLAALGPPAAHSARVGFATNLFAAGGIEAVTGTGDPDELASAFRASGSTLACLCSSDRRYAEQAAPAAEALRAAGARRIWLAGRPGERVARDQAAGIDGYLHAGIDAVAVLREAFDVLAVPA